MRALGLKSGVRGKIKSLRLEYEMVAAQVGPHHKRTQDPQTYPGHQGLDSTEERRGGLLTC